MHGTGNVSCDNKKGGLGGEAEDVGMVTQISALTRRWYGNVGMVTQISALTPLQSESIFNATVDRAYFFKNGPMMQLTSIIMKFLHEDLCTNKCIGKVKL